MNIEKIQLETDEAVIIQVRKHWFILCIQFVGIIFLAMIPIFLYFFVTKSTLLTQVPMQFEINIALLITLYSAWLLIMWMSAFNIWNNYYLDIWTITNKRLIAVDQKGFFSRTTASFRLDRLQDTSISVRGIIATLLDFGTLEMQTAGEERNFKASGLPHPGDLKAIILNAADTIATQNQQHATGV
jgi:hypothetical protein